MTNQDSLLTVRDLKVEFGSEGARTPVLRGVDFTLHRGERVAVVGRSGSGKTQILLAILGLLRGHPGRTGGSLRFNPPVGAGVELGPDSARPLRGTSLGMVFQHPRESLVPWKRVAGHLQMIRRRWRLARSDRADRELLASLGFSHPERILQAWPHELSGGEAQRVAIALATLPGPDLLLADEPTSALDAIIRRQVLKLLSDRVRKDGSSLLLVSHDLALVSEVVDRILVLSDGVIVADETPSALASADLADLHPGAGELMGAVRALDRDPVLESAGANE